MAPSPGHERTFGYTEPLRRFVQRDDTGPQANEIPNTMPSWMPGDDYLTNFRRATLTSRSMKATPACPGRLRSPPSRTRRASIPRIIPTSTRWRSSAMWRPYSKQYNLFRQKVGEESRRQHRTRDRVREDPRPGKADPRVRHPHGPAALYRANDEIEGTIASVSPPA